MNCYGDVARSSCPTALISFWMEKNIVNVENTNGVIKSKLTMAIGLRTSAADKTRRKTSNATDSESLSKN